MVILLGHGGSTTKVITPKIKQESYYAGITVAVGFEGVRTSPLQAWLNLVGLKSVEAVSDLFPTAG